MAQVLSVSPLQKEPAVRLGAHMSIAGGVDKAILRGREVGCETIQIFTRSPRQWRPRSLKDDEIQRFHENKKETGIDPVVAHDCYLINLGSPDGELWQKSLRVFIEEIGHCEALGLPYLVIHPGSHVGTGEEVGLKRIAQSLDLAHEQTEGSRVEVLLEITAGQGTNLGYSFEQLAKLLDLVAADQWLGICFDTCHAFAAGYELRTEEGYQATFQELAELVGLERLKFMHLNDAKGEVGSRLDRHEHIGHGTLGLEPFRMLLNDERFRHLPMVLETPKGPDLKEDRENLRVLRGLVSSGVPGDTS
ncbi:MAG: deoxyribonuclease IV [Chloroflexi bacterium B3_Chlor]|nr:MAG: deoxyribonuclease IV [Chloroflexi bacterium B3_Chlor]